MQCPVCSGIDLVMSERSGVEIDYCPKCRGVWLDRGELDKIIERSNISKQDYQQTPQQNYSKDHHYHKDYKYKKRENFFSELFDF
ncbi:zf-TFIIB domain-containing protein [uncultured Helicobacter sp.]|uniref:TFIIB-type zinc ribbon-containing protein n=1 Tax=uncultured Helicobacter sp. TaxID=175537 RepID=UPI002604DB0A|nr:zf-TFIIB domain-containing protein [uncultured Helicobacter sp.]